MDDLGFAEDLTFHTVITTCKRASNHSVNTSGCAEEDVKAMSCLPHFQENLENKEDQVKQQAEDTKVKRQVNVTLQLGDTTQQTLKKIKTSLKGIQTTIA